MEKRALLVVRDLVKHFPLRAGGFTFSAEKVHAVNGVSFVLDEGRTLGLVGESGCGKTTTGRMILRAIEPDEGHVFFQQPAEAVRAWETLEDEARRAAGAGRKRVLREAWNLRRQTDFLAYDRRRMVRERLGMQYIFQDPYLSLDPKMHVNEIITESLLANRLIRRSEMDTVARRYLDIVGLGGDSLHKFPHEFSGGQRQRLNIARAIAPGPKFIVCDEPVSALDVSIQSQILNLLIAIQREMKISYLFIAHNLPVVFYTCDEVAVMYAGKIVEHGPSRALHGRPLHPYTQLLMQVSPQLGVEKNYLAMPNFGQVPSLIHYPVGCTFYDRCPKREDRCRESFPPLLETEPGHSCACFVVNRGPVNP